MNIFFLDYNPRLAAQYHNDKHVVKMILETAQIMSTVYRHYGQDAPYAATHARHPAVLWAAHTTNNYVWLACLGLELGREYTRRYGKRHASIDVIGQLLQPPANMPDGPFTPPAQCMPEEYHDDSPVVAYRTYYMHDKAAMSTWRFPATKPEWFHAATTLPTL